jgi:ring-1,2-phenylacetyl-CoA epoxidase subunit PaaE
MKLVYANKTESDILFRERLDKLTKTDKKYFLTQEQKEGFGQGRITKDAFMTIIKEDLGILKADGFFICGPEEMIQSVKTALELFGVSESKIHFELFTTEAKSNPTPVTSSDFKGKTKVKVILDDETFDFEMHSGKTLLDAAMAEDLDAPYSCRGGVCSTCRAKVVKGTVKMNVNYTLTDKEVEQGYILTCQSHPTSEELIISYDE